MKKTLIFSLLAASFVLSQSNTVLAQGTLPGEGESCALPNPNDRGTLIAGTFQNVDGVLRCVAN